MAFGQASQAIGLFNLIPAWPLDGAEFSGDFIPVGGYLCGQICFPHRAIMGGHFLSMGFGPWHSPVTCIGG